VQNAKILLLLVAQITQPRFLIDVLSGDILGFDTFAFHAPAKLTDLRAHFLELGRRHTNADRGAGGVHAAIDVGSYQKSSRALSALDDLISYLRGCSHSQAEGGSAYQLAVGRSTLVLSTAAVHGRGNKRGVHDGGPVYKNPSDNTLC
jgi:hypothetical protein